MKPKKLLSLLLSLAMAFSLISTTAFAAEPDASENGFFQQIIDSLTGNKYTYVYAALTWDQYWAGENVYAAGSTASSDQLDTMSTTRAHSTPFPALLPTMVCTAAASSRRL